MKAPPILTLKEAAGELGIGRKRLMFAISLGQIRAIKLGGHWAVPATEIERIVARRNATEHGGTSARLQS